MPEEGNLGGSVGKQEVERLELRIQELQSTMCLNEYNNALIFQ